MKRESAWKTYGTKEKEEIEALSKRYIRFISCNKTERECVSSAIALAESCGYRSLQECIDQGIRLKAGDKLWASERGKALILIHIGSNPLEQGMNILGAHVDSPRLDIKQNPLYEEQGFAYLDTHYYGGIKHYQWLALPLALHGVVVKKDGSRLNVVVGEDPSDPVLTITDLLPHLGKQQMAKTASEFIDGEALDVLVGNAPLSASACETSEAGSAQEGAAADFAAPAAPAAAAADFAAPAAPAAAAAEEKEPVKAAILALLAEKYGIDEEDFLSSEFEVVPAGQARELGLDRSMILGYGQDDRVCAYTSLEAQLSFADIPLETSAVCILVDKEEIGSVGATGMESLFFENTIAEILQLCGETGPLALRRALARSSMLSSDVSAGFDPAYAPVFETKNTAFIGRGLVFNKYTGARGKSGSNDASAEYLARIRSIMEAGDVRFQTAELGRVDAGGGGTIAYIPARYGMDVIDAGVPVLSMHSPWEVSSKADVYEAYKGYRAFLLHR